MAARQTMMLADAADGWMLPPTKMSDRGAPVSTARGNGAASSHMKPTTAAGNTSDRHVKPIERSDPLIERDANSVARMGVREPPPSSYTVVASAGAETEGRATRADAASTAAQAMSVAARTPMSKPLTAAEREYDTSTMLSTPSEDKPFTRLVMGSMDDLSIGSPPTPKETQLALIAAEEEVHSLRAHTATMAVDLRTMQEQIALLRDRNEELEDELHHTIAEKDDLLLQVAGLVEQVTLLEMRTSGLKHAAMPRDNGYRPLDPVAEVEEETDVYDEQHRTPVGEKLKQAKVDCSVLQSIIMAAMAPHSDDSDAESIRKVMDSPNAKRLAKDSFYHLLEQNDRLKDKISSLERDISRVQGIGGAPGPPSSSTRFGASTKHRLDFGDDPVVDGSSRAFDVVEEELLEETEKRLALLQARMEQLSFIVAS